MIRAMVTSCVEGVIKRLSALGLLEITDREYLQHYGFTSRPLAGAEVILVADGNHVVAIASDDRRYRLAVGSGEVALYTDEGDFIHLKRGGKIAVTAGSTVTVTAPEVDIVAATKVTVTAPEVNIAAATKVAMTTPLLYVSGTIVAGVNIMDLNGTKSMAGMRSAYNSHTHKDNSHGATTDPPTQGM